MKSVNFKRKSKKSLLEIVRISGVMPEDEARKMRLPELREHLQNLMDNPTAGNALTQASEEEAAKTEQIKAEQKTAVEADAVKTERKPRAGTKRQTSATVFEAGEEDIPAKPETKREPARPRAVPRKTVMLVTDQKREKTEQLKEARDSDKEDVESESNGLTDKRADVEPTTDADGGEDSKSRLKSATLDSKMNHRTRRVEQPESDKPAADRPISEEKTDDDRETSSTATRRVDKTDAPADRGSGRRPLDSGEDVSGVLEIMPDGYGFLRRENYIQSNQDIYVPPQFIRRFNLRQGDFVVGPGRMKRDSDRYQAIFFIKSVNGLPPDRMIRRPHFERLTPIYPNERFTLETTRNELSTRIIDLVAPIGKGQRGMIVSPPKAGKTILLQKIANAISINDPDAKLIVLLIDERPEEVTDMQRSIKGEVVYSTFDKTPENHVRIVELVLERAMRLVELGEDVVILLDSVTRLSRAYNLTINPTGRTLSGGLDPGALYGPKRFFGAARNIENGGSLTIVATALVDTGSRMDEVIFEEFKGTGNMEVILDRKLSEKRVFPAIDIVRSGTRREELLLDRDQLESAWAIRKAFGQMDVTTVTETVISLLTKTNNNQHFVSSINVSLNDRSMFDAMGLKKQGNGSQKK